MRNNKSHISLLLYLMPFISLGVLIDPTTSVLGGEEETAQSKKEPKKEPSLKKEPAEEAKAQISASSSNSCLVSETALEDIKKARDKNEAKQKELVAKEVELKAKEQALIEELKKIQETRDFIAKTQGEKKKDHEEKVAKVVETLLSMSPKTAAKMLTSLDDHLAVSVLNQMDTKPLAKIMNLMDATRSSKLSEMMAGVVRATRSSTSYDVAATTIPIKKGGEKNDKQNEQYTHGESNPTGSDNQQSRGQRFDSGAEKPGLEKTAKAN